MRAIGLGLGLGLGLSWASLGTHVVTSLGSHGARLGGEVGVLTLVPGTFRAPPAAPYFRTAGDY